MTPRPVIVAVAYGLVGTLILGLVGIIALAVVQVPVPDALVNLASGALGAVAGLLARTGSDSPGDAQQVQVVNDPDDPVPVDAT